MDSLTHFLSKNIYNDVLYINISKVTALNVFQILIVSCALNRWQVRRVGICSSLFLLFFICFLLFLFLLFHFFISYFFYSKILGSVKSRALAQVARVGIRACHQYQELPGTFTLSLALAFPVLVIFFNYWYHLRGNLPLCLISMLAPLNKVV